MLSFEVLTLISITLTMSTVICCKLSNIQKIATHQT